MKKMRSVAIAGKCNFDNDHDDNFDYDYDYDATEVGTDLDEGGIVDHYAFDHDFDFGYDHGLGVFTLAVGQILKRGRDMVFRPRQV
jgi:hypothetical protein